MCRAVPWLSSHGLMWGTGMVFLVYQSKHLYGWLAFFFFSPKMWEREFKEKILFWLMSSAFCGFYGKSEQAWMLPLLCRSQIKQDYFKRKKNNFPWNRGCWADINSCQAQKYCRAGVLVLSGWERSYEWKWYFLNAEIAVFKVVWRLFQE